MNTEGLVQDKIVEETELFNLTELKNVLKTEGSDPGVTLIPEGEYMLNLPEGRYKLDLPKGILKDRDQITLHLSEIPDSMPDAAIVIRCSSRTPSFDQNDFFQIWCQKHSSDTIEFPYENSFIIGMPDRWDQAVSLELVTKSPFTISRITAQKRERPQGPRMTDEGLFSRLDLDRPGLEAVKGLAKTELVSYLRSRTEPEHAFHIKGPFPPQTILDAEKVCNNIIIGQKIPDPIRWDHNPNGYLEWQHAFNRMFPTISLLNAHAVTGNEKYMEKFIHFMETFIQQNPCPVDSNGGGSPAWETLSTAVRCYGVWFKAFIYLLQYENTPDALIIDMLKSFWMHAEHLYDFQGHGNNWIIVESRVLASIGILFPEYRESSKWRDEGFRRLSEEFKRQILPDGVQYEFSPGYHFMALQGFIDTWNLARLNGFSIKGITEEKLHESVRYVMHMTRPDLTRISLNDSGPSNVTGRITELLNAGKLFDDKEVIWTASGGKDGSKPAVLSTAFPYAGLCVMRTGWDAEDLWSFFDGGPMGRSHIHRDCLGIEIYAYGTPFIVDPGIVSYINDPWTQYMRNTVSHSTINVDGQDQRIINDNITKPAVDRLVWESNKHFDFAGSSFSDGYENVDGDIVHTRYVLFIKPLLWIVFDEISGTGSHCAESVLQFSPMRLIIDPNEPVFRTSRVNLPNLEVHIIGKNPELGITCGQENPVRGWISEYKKMETFYVPVNGAEVPVKGVNPYDHALQENVPAPRAAALFKGDLPLRWASVIIPVRSGPGSECIVEGEADNNDKTEVTCTFPDQKSVTACLDWNTKGKLDLRIAEDPGEEQDEWSVPLLKE